MLPNVNKILVFNEFFATVSIGLINFYFPLKPGNFLTIWATVSILIVILLGIREMLGLDLNSKIGTSKWYDVTKWSSLRKQQ